VCRRIVRSCAIVTDVKIVHAPSYGNRETEVILPFPMPPVQDDWAMKAAEQLEDRARCLLRLFFFSPQTGQITKAIVDKKKRRKEMSNQEC